MDPFDQPPVGAPVSFEPPASPSSGPRRGRMALVAVLTAGLIGGGIAGVSQLASADQPELAAAGDESVDEAVPPVDDADEPAGEPRTDQEPAPSNDPDRPAVDVEGQIVLDIGEGDPVVIDLADVANGDVKRLTECLGLPNFDLDVGGWGTSDVPMGDLDELFDDFFDHPPFDIGALEEWQPGDFGSFDLGGSVTVSGPDGVSVIDLGENGSVTVTKENGEVTVTTDGDATVSSIEDLVGELGTIFDGNFGVDIDQGALDEILRSLPNFDGRSFPQLDELQGIEPLDPDAVQACIDEILGG